VKTITDFEKKWEEEAKNLTLYHFSSIDSISKILESNYFFATHISFENDKREFLAAFEVLETVLNERLEDENEEQRKKVLKETLKWINKYLDYLNENEITKMVSETEKMKIYGAIESGSSISRYMYCIICFSEESDEKLHWNFYGNRGKGCCIAFKATELKKTFELNGVKAYLCKCIYDKTEQKDFINALIEKTFEQESLLQKPELFGKELLNMFLQYACIIKDWQNESEWRLVYKQIPSELMKLRQKNVAYCEIPITNLNSCCQEILLGPRVNESEVKSKLNNGLVKNDLQGIIFGKSKVEI
jgi:hypothetical protein